MTYRARCARRRELTEQIGIKSAYVDGGIRVRVWTRRGDTRRPIARPRRRGTLTITAIDRVAPPLVPVPLDWPLGHVERLAAGHYIVNFARPGR